MKKKKQHEKINSNLRNNKLHTQLKTGQNEPPPKTGHAINCSRRISIPCSTCDTDTGKSTTRAVTDKRALLWPQRELTIMKVLSPLFLKMVTCNFVYRRDAPNSKKKCIK